MNKYYIFIFFILTTNLFSEYIQREKIDTTKPAIQVSTCFDRDCIIKTGNTIETKDQYHTIKKQDKFFITDIVNIKDKETAKQIQKKYNKQFPDSILRNRYSYEKKQKLDKPNTNKQHTIIKKKKKNILKIIGDKYKEALKLYTDKNYEECYTKFNDLFEKNLNNININFYLGRCAFEIKKYDDAILAFDRVLFEKPDSLRTKVEIARAHFIVKNYKEAKTIFIEIKDDPNSDAQIIKLAEEYLKKIDSLVSKHSITAMIMEGIHYDSNLNTNSKYDTFNNLYLSNYNVYINVNNTTKDLSTWYHQDIGTFKHIYKYSDSLNIKNDFTLYHRDTFQSIYNTNTIKLLSYNPSLNILYNEKLNIDYGIYGDIMWYGGVKYLSSFALFPKINYIIDKNNNTTTEIKLQKKFYRQSTNKDKNSKYIEIKSKLTKNINDKVSLSPTITFSRERMINTKSTQTRVDNFAFNFSSSLNYMLTDKFLLNPSISYKYTLYDDTNIFYQTKEEDHKYSIGLSSTYIFNPTWIIQGTSSYTRQDSNVRPYDYKKYSYGINIIRTF